MEIAIVKIQKNSTVGVYLFFCRDRRVAFDHLCRDSVFVGRPASLVCRRFALVLVFGTLAREKSAFRGRLD